MQDSAVLLRALPGEVLDNPRPGDAWERCALAGSSDRALVDAVAKAITPPKITASSSFVLHAPMELIARARLLRLAPPASRPEGRRRIAEIATRYARSGSEIEAAPRSYADETPALNALTAAIPAGDVAEADGALAWLLDRVSSPALIAGLADAVIPALGAAAHAPILLAMFLNSPKMGEAYGGLLRAPVRYLTLQGAARLTWPTSAVSSTTPSGDLFDVLVSPPHVDSPSLFIAPTMLAAEAGGLAERLLAGPTHALSLEDAERSLLRLAAWSMLQDDARHAPYGWTHCLTLPQGVLTVAAVAGDRRAAIRVAATHVLGLRAAQGNAALDPAGPLPPPTARSLPGASPAEAASIAFHTPPEETGPMRATLAGHAVSHADAHLAKYTLACFDAATRDPQAAPLYLAAAAYLGAWWDENSNAAFGD
ncbi:MAG: hypothetical protein JWO83_1765 [Caulobacteraceae bacterium]|nr:hypothetical protein [Caulobacteraceae bacterium]